MKRMRNFWTSIEHYSLLEKLKNFRVMEVKQKKIFIYNACKRGFLVFLSAFKKSAFVSVFSVHFYGNKSKFIEIHIHPPTVHFTKRT